MRQAHLLVFFIDGDFVSKFGVVLSLLSPHCVVTSRLHELIWAPAAGGMQWLEQGDGAQHRCIVVFLQLCYFG